jgi:anthranilate/para-aminobenzoate synthase component II
VKVVIVDFNDSFTWNIFSILKEMDKSLEIEVVHWLDFEIPSTQRSVVILGPGPGHPNEYKKIRNKIRAMLKDDSLYLMGICLGHQLIAQTMIFRIISSKSLVHGQCEQITLPAWKGLFPKDLSGKTVEVQRYNSLAVQEQQKSKPELRTLVKRGEVLMMKYKNGVSYQFHPESVGTTCPSSFFEEALKFLYNRGDEHSTQNHRSI